MNKWFKVSLVSTLALGTLIGCGTKQDATSGQTAGPGEKTKFSIALRTLAFNYVEKSPNLNEDKWVKRLEEKTNTDLNIVLVPHKEYEQKMVQMFATGDVADVMQGSGGVNGKEMAGSVQAGVFMPLDDLLKKHGQNLLKKIPKDAWDQVTYQGKIYAIPEYLSNPSRRATWVRKDLLDKAGLKVPKTVEETLDMLRAFKKLGIENPFMGRQDFKYADTFFGAYDVYPVFVDVREAGRPGRAEVFRLGKYAEGARRLQDDVR